MFAFTYVQYGYVSRNLDEEQNIIRSKNSAHVAPVLCLYQLWV